MSMSSKEPSSSKAGASTFNNPARKTSLFGNMKRKQTKKEGCGTSEIERQGDAIHENKRRGLKSKSSFDSDFNSEKGHKNHGETGNHHNRMHEPIRRTSSQIVLNTSGQAIAHEMIDDSFAGDGANESYRESKPKQGTYLLQDFPSVSAIEGGERVGSSSNIRDQVSFGGPVTEFVSRGQSDQFITQV